jgi:hypothetical protein
MQLWEYLLAEDKRLDLSDPARAWDWIRHQSWMTTPARWTNRAQEAWPRSLQALKSIAARCRRKRPRTLTEEQSREYEELDSVAALYIDSLRPAIVFRPRGPGVLFADTFHFAVTPTEMMEFPPGSGEMQRVFVQRPTEHYFERDDWSVFWQVVFHGLLTGSGQAVCEVCGGLLGDKTPLGRTKKQRQCAKCRRKKWWDKQPIEKKREKWRIDNKKRKRKEQP